MSWRSVLQERWAIVREALGFKRIYGQIGLGVENLDRAVAWYCDRFRMESKRDRDNPQRAYVGHEFEDGFYAMFTLTQAPAAHRQDCFDGHPILYTKRLEKVHEDFISRGIRVWPIQTDSGGNRFFQFEDSEGNKIEVCLEPGDPSDWWKKMDQPKTGSA